jgi:hypothetical protein
MSVLVTLKPSALLRLKDPVTLSQRLERRRYLYRQKVGQDLRSLGVFGFAEDSTA